MNLDGLLERHEKVALMFSGGKDSLCCLELARPWLDQLLVMYVDTGANFPEIDALIGEIEPQCAQFVRIRTDVRSWIADNGTPADVVPVNATREGRLVNGTTGLLVSSYMDCCRANLWMPSAAAWQKHGVTAVIRGQRHAEHRKSYTRNGMVIDGIELVHPIEDWSESDVIRFLTTRGYPAHTDVRYRLGHSSLDCRVCTAYLDVTEDRLAYIRKRHPADHEYVVNVVKMIGDELQRELQPMIKLIDEE